MVQETFLHAVRGLESFEGGHPALFRAWLVRVAGNTCKNELRHRARRLEPVATEITAEMAVVPFTTDRDVDAASRRSQLKTALETLSASEREILQLAELEELSYREIASRLEISLSAVKMRVVRSRVALAGALRALRPEVTPS